MVRTGLGVEKEGITWCDNRSHDQSDTAFLPMHSEDSVISFFFGVHSCLPSRIVTQPWKIIVFFKINH